MRVSVTSAGACAIAGSAMRTVAHKPTANRIVAFSMVSFLAFLRRPAIRLGAGAAHQHCAFTFAQALRLPERLDGLFVVDDRERASPVGSPQTALETPRVEHARKRVPDVREREGFFR